MKTLICILSTRCIVAVLIALYGTASQAGHCNSVVVRQKQIVATAAVIIPQGFVAVPVAVPVGTPSYSYYQYPQYQTQVSDPFLEKPAATQGYGTASTHEAPPVPYSLIAQHCLKCHQPDAAAWKKTKLDMQGDLSPEVRLKMIQRILHDDPKLRMPKGKVLDAQQIGLLCQEIAGQQAPPEPPKPEPEK